MIGIRLFPLLLVLLFNFHVLISAFRFRKRAGENCWEGDNCTYCEVPPYYHQQLQIIPNPSGYRINDGMSATVYCKERGRSFINSVLSVSGVSKTDIFFNEGITVNCSKGIIYPAIFEDDQWCAFGCAEVPDDVYNIEYPDLTYQTDLAVTPVYTDSTKEITVSCKAGYSDAVGDEGESNIRCTSSGYTGYIRKCVEGCDYPLSEGSHDLETQPNYEIGYSYYPVNDSAAIWVGCAGDEWEYPIYCIGSYGWINTDLLTCAKETSGALTHSCVNSVVVFVILLFHVCLFLY